MKYRIKEIETGTIYHTAYETIDEAKEALKEVVNDNLYGAEFREINFEIIPC